MPRCPFCQKTFRTLEDEQEMHACPYCGEFRPDSELQTTMVDYICQVCKSRREMAINHKVDEDPEQIFNDIFVEEVPTCPECMNKKWWAEHAKTS